MRHGKHIKVLGKGSSTLLNDPLIVRMFLESLVKSVGMTMLGEPVIHEVAIEIEKLKREPFEDEGGVTGLACLSTSHCSIHTWPARHFFVSDIFSCRDFDHDAVLECLRQHFGTFAVKMTDVSESLDYPDDN